MSGDVITTTGIVREHHRGDHFQVDVRIGPHVHNVLCRRAGRLVTHKILVLPGDVVTVEVSAHDTSRGRIVYRGVRPA
jgi:translation initiation factor IF-1